MPGCDNIVIIGFMGCGKSTVAAELAHLCGWRVLDLDDVIVATAGKTIPEIFAEEGEGFFRSLETSALRGLLGRKGLVVATGGGVVTRNENWPLMRELGPVVFLRTALDILRARLQSPSGRPLADGLSWQDIKSRYQQRLPLYQQADVIVDVTDESPAEVARIILRAIENGLDEKHG